MYHHNDQNNHYYNDDYDKKNYEDVVYGTNASHKEYISPQELSESCIWLTLHITSLLYMTANTWRKGRQVTNVMQQNAFAKRIYNKNML